MFRVVTGVRIANHSKMIHLEIKESRIGSYEDDSWKSPGSLEGLIRDVDYSFLQPDSRSINLDKIVVPADYVVTGKFFSFFLFLLRLIHGDKLIILIFRSEVYKNPKHLCCRTRVDFAYGSTRYKIRCGNKETFKKHEYLVQFRYISQIFNILWKK